MAGILKGLNPCFLGHWAIPENIHTYPRGHRRRWKSCNKCSVSMTGNHKFPPNFANFNPNSRKTIQVLAKFWNSSRFAKNLQKLQLSFLEILKFLGVQFSVVHWVGGGGGVFSGIAHQTSEAQGSRLVCLFLEKNRKDPVHLSSLPCSYQ